MCDEQWANIDLSAFATVFDPRQQEALRNGFDKWAEGKPMIETGRPLTAIPWMNDNGRQEETKDDA